MTAKSFNARMMTLAQAELGAIHTIVGLNAAPGIAAVTAAWKACKKTISKSAIVRQWRLINGL